MTIQDSIRRLISGFKVRAKCIGYDYDPAGSSSEYAPDSNDVSVLQPFFDRALAEDDFYFVVGGAGSPHFTLLSRTLNEIAPISKEPR